MYFWIVNSDLRKPPTSPTPNEPLLYYSERQTTPNLTSMGERKDTEREIVRVGKEERCSRKFDTTFTPSRQNLYTWRLT